MLLRSALGGAAPETLLRLFSLQHAGGGRLAATGRIFGSDGVPEVLGVLMVGSLIACAVLTPNKSSEPREVQVSIACLDHRPFVSNPGVATLMSHTLSGAAFWGRRCADGRTSSTRTSLSSAGARASRSSPEDCGSFLPATAVHRLPLRDRGVFSARAQFEVESGRRGARRRDVLLPEESRTSTRWPARPVSRRAPSDPTVGGWRTGADLAWRRRRDAHSVCGFLAVRVPTIR